MNERRLCRLQYAAGRVEHCPEDRCPFWEPGGVALAGRCAIEHVDLRANDEVVHWLVDLRCGLARAEATGAPPDTHTRRLFYRLVDSGIREFPDRPPDITAAELRVGSDAAPPGPGDSELTT